MKIGLMIGGVFLITCAIIGHNSIPSIISHAENLLTPLDGGMNCTTIVENGCLELTFAKTAFEFANLGLGLIGILFVGYGWLTNNEKKEYLVTRKTENPTVKILEEFFA